ncbi:MAG TPA: 3'-5' exonuclease [Candidatus Peribacteraceae bacterium]|nr:3'-5' exonuclease [Candidatus Peribacteraceae bacterium]
MAGLPAFTVFDVETTGLDPRRGHRIVEIAGMRIENGVACEDRTFLSLVNPERPIPAEARQVHRISDADVAAAPTIDQVLPLFLNFASDSILVAHNADFDVGFLTAEKECCWGYVELPECLCTLRLSRALYPREFRHSLDVLARRFSLPIPETRHRALTDVTLTAQAFLRMLRDHSIQSVEALRQKAALRQLVA